MADKRQAAGASSSEIRTDEVTLLDQILDNISPAAEPQKRAFARDIIAEFAQQVLDGTIVYARDTEAMIKARIGQLDGLISAQLNEVLHAPEFQKLEASWRGLHYLVHQSETSPQLKIKVFNVSKKDLGKDLERAPEFDQSALFKRPTRKSTGCSAARPSGCSSATMSSATTRRIWRCSSACRTWRRRRTRRSSRPPIRR